MLPFINFIKVVYEITVFYKRVIWRPTGWETLIETIQSINARIIYLFSSSCHILIIIDLKYK